MFNEINYNQVGEDVLKEFRRTFDTTRNIVVCPFTIVQGIDSITQGTYTVDPKAFKETTYKRIFNGQSPVIFLWKNSTKCKSQKTPGGLPDFEKPAVKELGIGEYFYGILQDEHQSINYDNDEDGNAKINSTSEVRILLEGELTMEYYFNGWVLPEVNEDIYMTDNITLYRDMENKVLYSEVILKKITDELKNLVTNSEALLLKSGPGESYIWPYVSESELSLVKPEVGFELRNVITSQVGEKNKLNGYSKGVKSIQITTEEPALVSSITAIGRPVSYTKNDDGTFTEYVEEARHLLPSALMKPKSDPLHGINAPNDKLIFLPDGKISQSKEFNSWFTIFKGWFYNEYKQTENIGVIKFDSHKEALNSSLDKRSDSTPPEDDPDGKKVIKQQAYWNNWKIDMSVFKDKEPKNTFKTYSPYSEEYITYKDIMNANDVLAMNSFIDFDMLKLPVEYEARVPGGIFNLTIGVIKKLFGGQKGLLSQSLRTSYRHIPVFGDYSYMNLILDGMIDSETNKKGYVPLAFFSEERSKTMFGKNTTSFTMRIELSDEYMDVEGNIKNTVGLGQGDNGKYNGDCTVVSTSKSYLIDAIIFKGISKSNIRINYYDIVDTYNEDNKNAISMIAQTNNKKTDSFTDWTLVVKTSEWSTSETQDKTPDVDDIYPDVQLGTEVELIKKWIDINEGQTLSPDDLNEYFENDINWYTKFKEDTGVEISEDDFKKTYNVELQFSISYTVSGKSYYYENSNNRDVLYLLEDYIKPISSNYNKIIDLTISNWDSIPEYNILTDKARTSYIDVGLGQGNIGNHWGYTHLSHNVVLNNLVTTFSSSHILECFSGILSKNFESKTPESVDDSIYENRVFEKEISDKTHDKRTLTGFVQIALSYDVDNVMFGIDHVVYNVNLINIKYVKKSDI